MTAHVEVAVGPVIAGLLGLAAPTLSLALDDRPCTLADVVSALEGCTAGALVDARTGVLRRHIHVRVNRQPVARLDHPLRADDRVRIDLRMIESG
jgi:hypothetical protein